MADARSAHGELIVLGMGKLGGSELNFSSDVDLVFLYGSGEGETDGPAPLALEEYFTRQGRLVIRLLDTAHRGRLRLPRRHAAAPVRRQRPAGGELRFFEDYLAAHGRDWERYAYVKARAITGAALFEPLRGNVLRPFVYRRYLDFGVFESLREMKATDRARRAASRPRRRA